MAAVQQAHPTDTVEVWAEDEQRVGLKPILRRVWAPVGHRPVAVVQPRYEWLYTYGFVEPTTGKLVWLLLPTVNIPTFSLALAEFARETQAGAGKQIVLILDGAGWHTSRHLTVPEGIHIIVQPAKSPELQPAEHLWPLTNEALANKHFEDLSALEEALAQRCRTLLDQPDVIRATTLFHWWPPASTIQT